MSEPWERLRQARKQAGYETAEDAAKAFGFNVATYRSHENGTRGLRPDVADRYARAFKVDSAWLLYGTGSAERRNLVPIMGYIGGGAEIEPEFEQPPPDGFEQVEIPFPLPGEMIGLEVKGESMFPRYEPGDVVICYREQRKGTDSYLGEEVAVRTADGRRYLKRLLRGYSPGRYNLESWNARMIEDAVIEWVGEIFTILPARQVRHVTNASLKGAGKAPPATRTSSS